MMPGTDGAQGELTGTEPLAEVARQATAHAGLSIVVYHQGGAETALLTPGQPVIVGRAEPADLRVPDRKLSREHARFTLLENRVLVEDLGSRNGTWLSGRRVERVALDIGGEVLLGEVLARVHGLGAGGPRTAGEESFRHQLDDEEARARHLRRGFALLAVRAPDGDAPGDWIGCVRERLRPVDQLSAFGPDRLLVLLPEVDAASALGLARAVASPLGVAGGTPRVGLAVYPGAASTVEELIDRALRSLERTSAREPVVQASDAWSDSSAPEVGSAIVAGAAMRGLLATAARVAGARIPVILLGETGTGKEVLARYIHEQGPRRERRMVRVNCGAIPSQLIESTLFGHEKGAFTGAQQQHRGVFEEADKGSVFLDEIGELPLAAQVALLRVLETGSFCRVGGTREIAVDVRVIAATHRDLEAMVAQGQFRDDLYYRLSTMVLELPPLRERMEEVEPLARRFLSLANEANGRQVRGLSPEALALFKAHSWPGNVRELKNALERAVVVATGELITAEDLPARVRATRAPDALPPRAQRPPEDVARREDSPGAEAELKAQVKDYESQLLEKTLRSANWNRTEAARQLGMPVRTLSYRMKVLGLKKREA
ncbi:sigma 54-interacting transcriptional regulator [Corallococcus sp. CA053C]|uniref:sigma 54-interacting transcriptional regulator n=1 Tax=Corallococcus sp. CA053C TaxID=2316732 RepID=UPI001F3720B5|nr:sigma 54-interacting transcriptional regulator [Corallococcus sp. CA053C]